MATLGLNARPGTVGLLTVAHASASALLSLRACSRSSLPVSALAKSASMAGERSTGSTCTVPLPQHERPRHAVLYGRCGLEATASPRNSSAPQCVHM